MLINRLIVPAIECIVYALTGALGQQALLPFIVTTSGLSIVLYTLSHEPAEGPQETRRIFLSLNLDLRLNSEFIGTGMNQGQ